MRGSETAPVLARAAALVALACVAAPAGELRGQQGEERPRAREVGVVVGTLPTGAHNAITDVRGVRVGHHTLRAGDSLRTGVTAVLPHGGDLFRRKVPGAVAVGNGFGKLVGLSQVNELGEIETPILLTGTLSVFRAADALVDTLLEDPAHRHVESINPVVGETNDGGLSDIRARPIGPRHVRAALRDASAGPVEEGSVGAGTGTRALGWKGGIGTSSRVLPDAEGGFTLGVLVQSNFGGRLRVDGVPVWRGLRKPGGESGASGGGRGPDEGSIMIVLATDAPLGHRELVRVARRAFGGLARVGSHREHGSGDYAVAFSTRPYDEARRVRDGRVLNGLFRAAQEATEEAILNSLFRATAVTGFRGRRAEALPVDRVVEILRSRGALEGREP